MRNAVVEDVQNEAAELLSSWDRLWSSRNLAPYEALSLLAMYAHLRRFASSDLNQDEAKKLNDLVELKADQLIDLVSRLAPPTGWISEAQSMSEAWNQPMSADQGEARERQARKLFSQLDQYELALSGSIILRGPEVCTSGPLASWAKVVERCGEFFIDDKEAFYSAAPFATSTIEAYRQDVLFDDVLGKAVAKYRLLQEMLEEEEALRG